MNDNTGFHVPVREIRADVIDTGLNGSENYAECRSTTPQSLGAAAIA